jgi:dinuclear metal center YbgI/SA1388 family protein
MASASEVAAFLDDLLSTARYPDYPAALNGLQLDHRGPLRRVVTAVDFSAGTIAGAIAADANMLVLHHGMFWGGLQRLVGSAYERLRMLFDHDIAVYASHLPLDANQEIGNCALLARALGLARTDRFGEYQGTQIGVAGASDLLTADLLAQAIAFAGEFGGTARATAFVDGHRTRRWAVLTGSGADTATLRLAATQGIDTLITGEGPHHTTVDAPDLGVVVIYCGHYASETLGVRALAQLIAERFGIPAEFLPVPTGS